jgi:hypothetical protein
MIFLKQVNRNFYPKSSLLSSFSATENEHLLFGFSTEIMSGKYSFECVHIKCYYLQKRKSLFKNDFFKAS